jgi:hypothetical protein
MFVAISEECTASIFRLEELAKQQAELAKLEIVWMEVE